MNQEMSEQKQKKSKKSRASAREIRKFCEMPRHITMTRRFDLLFVICSLSTTRSSHANYTVVVESNNAVNTLNIYIGPTGIKSTIIQS